MEWYLAVIRNYAGFSGRAQRKEYWMFFLFNLVISWVLGFLDGMMGLTWGEGVGAMGMTSGLYSLFILIPSLAVGVRRLHDIGRSGWSMLIALIPLVGAIILIVWFAKEGDHGTNKYGPDPMRPDFEDQLDEMGQE